MRRRTILLSSLFSSASAAACVVLFSCVGGDPAERPTESPDGGVDAAADASEPPPNDAAGVPKPCDPAAPFTLSEALATLHVSGVMERAPFLSPDELTIYFSRGPVDDEPQVGRDVFVARRSSRTDAFGVPDRVDGVSSESEDDRPSLPRSGLLMYFRSLRPKDGGTEQTFFVSSRATTTAAFGEPKLMAVDLPADVNLAHAPVVSHDGRTLYFAANTPSDGGAPSHDLYRATLTTSSTAADVTPIHALRSAAHESMPTLSEDEKVIYFRRFPAAADGEGNQEGIFMSTRANDSADWEPPVRVASVSSPTGTASPGWISPDLCRLYFRLGDTLMVASKPPPP